MLFSLLLLSGIFAKAQTAYVPSTYDGNLYVIDVATATVVDTVYLGPDSITDPRGVSVSPDGKKVWISDSERNLAYVIDAFTNTVLDTIPLGDGPGGIVVSPDGSLVYSGNFDDSTVMVIDALTHQVIDTIIVGDGPGLMGVSPDGTELYVTVSDLNEVVLVNTNNGTVVDTFPAGDNPQALALSPDGSEIYVTNFYDTIVVVLDASTKMITDTILAGEGGAGLAFTPDGSMLYVANFWDATVSAINTSTKTVVATIPVGGDPSGLSATPDGTQIYVANQEDSTVMVIDVATNTVVDTIEVGYGPVAAGNFISIYPNLTNFTALPLNLPGFNKGAATWGNIEASGGLGFAIAGLGPGNVPTTQLYTYEGNDSFALFSAPAVRNITADGPGYLDWGDFNNDNMIDLALCGEDANGQNIVWLYRNDTKTGGTFFGSYSFFRGNWSSVAWGDYDNDGDLDVLAVGVDARDQTSRIYVNNDTSFTDGVRLPGYFDASGDWGDYDNDGDLDILLTGRDSTSGNASVVVLRNDGNDVFTDIGGGFTGLYQSNGKFADLDNDGDLDILAAGYTNSNMPSTTIYENDGNGAFTAVANSGLIHMAYANFSIGDYDNDGLPDIVMAGDYTGNLDPVSRLYKNIGNLTFEFVDIGLKATTQAGVAFGDYDTDGDLDILLTGLNFPTPSKGYVYRNDAASPNMAPSIPANLSAIAANGGNSIEFSWDASTDPETDSDGLSYVMSIGQINIIDIASPLADTTSGLRWVASSGPIQGNSWTLSEVAIGETYCAMVEAVDAGYETSGWSDQACLMTTSLDKNLNPMLLKAYPNPVKNQLTVELDGTPRLTALRVIDMNGKIVLQKSVNQVEMTILDVSRLTRGMYILKGETDDQTISLKFIKE